MTALDRFAEYFESVGCEFERSGDDALTAGIEVEVQDDEGEGGGEGGDAESALFMDVIVQRDGDEEEEQLACYVVWPLSVPSERLADAAQLVCRANFGVLVGCIELDFDDGEVRAKTGLDVVTLDNAVCEHLFQNSMNLTMMYMPALQAMLEQGLGVEEALELVEG